MTHAQRAALPFIGEGRADLIIAGLAIAQAIVERWNYPRLVTVDAGLLEGAWLELLKRKNC
jgi:exopolyphosphatase/guanosine-5'-triphosphate,3'-diphosphate pyrophosphatase